MPVTARVSLSPAVFNQGKSLLGTWGGDSVPDRDYRPLWRGCWPRDRFPVARPAVEALSSSTEADRGAEGPRLGQGRPAADRHDAEMRRRGSCVSASTSTTRSPATTACSAVPRSSAGWCRPISASSKNAVRDFLNGSRPQGRVHGIAGLRLRRAHGPRRALSWCRSSSSRPPARPATTLFLVSHKTRHPYPRPET